MLLVSTLGASALQGAPAAHFPAISRRRSSRYCEKGVFDPTGPEGFSIETLERFKLPLVNKFYATQNYKASANRNDKVFVIRKKCPNDAIVAAARLTDKKQRTRDPSLRTHTPGIVYFLRSVYVDPMHRRRGLAASLLERIETFLDTEGAVCYTFPLGSLTQLYSQAGFSSCLQQQDILPSFTLDEFDAISRQQKDPIDFMVRFAR